MTRLNKWLLGIVIFGFVFCCGVVVWLWNNEYIVVISRLSSGTTEDDESATPPARSENQPGDQARRNVSQSKALRASGPSSENQPNGQARRNDSQPKALRAPEQSKTHRGPHGPETSR